MTQSTTERAVTLTSTVLGSGPGLLLAHGATGSIETNFAPVLPALAAGHTVVAPDYPGSGATPAATAPLTLDALADALVAEAEAAGVDRCTVLGFSLGTAVAVRAATRHPDRVAGLVLTAGFATPDPGLRRATHDWQRNVPAGHVRQVELVREVDTTADLAGITVPTLVIATTRDTLVAPVGSRALADGIPGARYTEIAADHLVMVERPDEWRDAVLRFLGEHRL
ncbi:alpha/beta fold hydrolase [Allostreptomyces psammosilenae]|uniref:Pimeloyl-ACP methyl ester carboxylesterase n=1 Tax=Allostreptomyces psammosilenae TaxID=1892865 RepID=A0A853A3K7_9ACTN|nr:alpha/beta fold hydrolase [Allostreptomyces psammosilenae]NYI05092.1 pimeloyl-ACP methyl ester carboxylesterase [Allostreptomyces psammosilenae]